MRTPGRARRTAGRTATTLLAMVLAATATATPVLAAATGPSSTVVVTLRDQLAGTPVTDRSADLLAQQQAVLAGLQGAAPTDVRHLRTANVMVATMTAAQQRQLAADPRVAGVAPDQVISAGVSPAKRVTPRPQAPAATPPSLPPTAAPADACTGTETEPQLEPEALSTMRVRSDDAGEPTAHALGYDGDGVTVGIVTTNIDPENPDFQRADGTSAITDYVSFGADGLNGSGEAAEAFGDVSSIVAQGRVTYDVADVINPLAVTLPDGHCWIRIEGVAPEADVLVADSQDQGNLTTGGLVQGIDWAVANGADVLSESFGGPVVPDRSALLAVQAANDAALDAGVTVVVSSGDSGTTSTIGSPAADPRIISVGASITGRLASQVGGYGMTRFGSGGWPDATIADFSSSGTTVGGGTIDLVAPGDAGWSACSTAPQYEKCDEVGNRDTPSNLLAFAGTSESAPFVAGIASLVIEAYREGHGGASPTPEQVRLILTGTASDLGLPADQQGAGLVDARAAVIAARNLPDPAPTSPDLPAGPVEDSLIAGDAQLQAAATGSTELETTVTNAGPTPVDLSDARITVEDSTDGGHFPIAFDPAAETYADGYWGGTLVAATQEVEIPAGTAWASVRVAVAPGDPDVESTAEIVALDPDGTPVAWGWSQRGLRIWLPAPEAGTWTFVLQAGADNPWTGELAVDLGVRRTLAAAAADTTVLAPGATTTVRATVPMPSAPGDVAAMLRVDDQLTVPVVLRTPADLSAGPVELTGLAFTGNGRSPNQVITREVDVPNGTISLTAATTFDDGFVGDVLGMLVRPDGTVASVTGNDPSSKTAPRSLQQTVAPPVAGRWTVVLMVLDALTLKADADIGYRMVLSTDATARTASGLPAGEDIVAGSTRTVRLSVTNPGDTPLEFTVDPRLAGEVTVDLPVASGKAAQTLPVTEFFDQPMFVIPQFSTALTVQAQASTPIVLEASGPSGVPDLLTAAGTSPRVTVGAQDLVPGAWSTYLGPVGPVVGTSPAGSATVTAQVRTARFDPTVTDAAGHAFVSATGEVPDTVQIVEVAPGATGTIEVRLQIPATGAQVVSGWLALITPPQAGGPTSGTVGSNTTGDVLALFSYRYSVVPAPVTTTPPPPTTQVPVPPTTTPSTSTTSDTVTTPTTTATTSSSRELSATGAPVETPAVWGVLLLLLGGAVLVAVRVRRRGEH
ncbi:S8 family serine peptidase [Nakamurella sp. YIM 132087]|uniref:S8 family serine peptidase n=1 Tax=Nakamurella alba TaxID=2665158 RepID=A0A7K1FNJ0_9ACTN|nr:S8 family serine peptidase [Nakamurella alba]MTD15737.1 S8 family serine peptidase [Nakamurella alba]